MPYWGVCTDCFNLRSYYINMKDKNFTQKEHFTNYIFEEMELYRARNKSREFWQHLFDLVEANPKEVIHVDCYPLERFGYLYYDVKISCESEKIQKLCDQIYERYYHLALLHPIKLS